MRKKILEQRYLSNFQKQPLKVACEKISLKISQNSQENIYVLQLYHKTTAQMFPCEIRKSFKNTCFEEHLRTTASELLH